MPSLAVVYLAFGKRDFHRQCCYSVYSLLQHCSGDFHVFVFTDDVAFFDRYLKENHISFISLSEEDLSRMRGTVDFINRTKIAVIDRVISSNPQTEVVVFIDSDTVITGDLTVLAARVDSQHSLFHCDEFFFNELENLPVSNLTKQLYLEVSSGKISFALTDQSHVMTTTFLARNTGVVGIHRSNHHLLAYVFDLTDAIYSRVKHHTAEQLAFSYILSRYTNALTCEDIVFHYWNSVQKTIMKRSLLKIFRNRKFDKLSYENKRKHIAQGFQDHIRSVKSFSNKYLERSIELLNNDELVEGYLYAIRAFITQPKTASIFAADYLHHTKRILQKLQLGKFRH